MKFSHSRRLISLVLTACLLLMVVGSAFAQGLGQTYTSPDGSLSFNYPDGWVTSESFADLIFIASSQTALDRINGDSDNSSLASGEIVYYIIGPVAAEAAFSVDPTLPAVEALQALATSLSSDSSDSENTTTIGEPAELTIGDYSAARVTIASPDLEGLIIALKPSDDTVVIGLLATPPGETESAEAQFRSVLETVKYAPPPPPQPVEVGELTTQFASNDARLTAQMPEGWVGTESYGSYTLASSLATQQKYSDEYTVDSGNVIVEVITPESLRDSYQAPTDDAQAAVVAMANYWGVESDVAPVDLTSDGFTAFSVSAPSVFGSAYFMSFLVDGQVFVFRASTAFGEDGSIWQDVLLAIAHTVAYRTFVAPEVAGTINWRVLQDPATDMAYVTITQLDLAADGTLFGMDTSSGAVYTIGADGTITPVLSNLNFEASIYSGDFAVAPDGSFWVTDSSTYGVHHFGLDGNEIGTAIPGDENNPAYTVKIEFGPDGNLYVLDGVQNADDEYVTDSRIRVFDATGAPLKEFTLSGKEAGSPTDFSIAPDGNLYVLSYSQFLVADFDGNLLPSPALLSPGMPKQVEFAADGSPILSFDITNYDTDPYTVYRSLVKYGADGVAVSAFGEAIPNDWTDAIPEGQLQSVYDFVVLPDGNLVIADGYYPYTQIVNVTLAQ